MGRGYRCVVPVKVGKAAFRVTLDTGAARSLIRADFAAQLRKSQQTAEAVLQRAQADEAISCVGICSDMESGVLEFVQSLRLRFEGVRDGRGSAPAAEIEVPFAELKGASDALLIGFPLLLSWGMQFDQDDDGNIWIELELM